MPIPAISVLMCVHNGEAYLEEATDSILNQDFEDFELVIVDDASTDATQQILNRYAKADARVKVIRNGSNLGLTKSLNVGLETAKGEFIARMDADDASYPNRLSLQLEAMQSDPELIILGAGCEIVGEKDHRFGRSSEALSSAQILWHLCLAPVCYHPTYFFRRVLSDGQPVRYDTTFDTAQDYDLWSRLSEQGPTQVTDAVVLKYRRHAEGISVKKRTRQRQNARNVSLRHMQRIVGSEDSARLTPLVDAMAGEMAHDKAGVASVLRAASLMRRLVSGSALPRDQARPISRKIAAFAADAILSRCQGLKSPRMLLYFTLFGLPLLPDIVVEAIRHPTRLRKAIQTRHIGGAQ